MADRDVELALHRQADFLRRLASQLGLARVSARRYLEYLVTKGSARIVPKYGAAGRPEKFYVWTGAQR